MPGIGWDESGQILTKLKICRQMSSRCPGDVNEQLLSPILTSVQHPTDAQSYIRFNVQWIKKVCPQNLVNTMSYSYVILTKTWRLIMSYGRHIVSWETDRHIICHFPHFFFKWASTSLVISQDHSILKGDAKWHLPTKAHLILPT